MTADLLREKIKGAKGRVTLILSDGGIATVPIEGATITTGFSGNEILQSPNFGSYRVGAILDVFLPTSKGVISIDSSARLGSDPEFFFMKDNDIVPSTSVLRGVSDDEVVPDGFQGELNPEPGTCRVVTGVFIGRALQRAAGYAKDFGAKLNFEVAHVISDKAWKGVAMTTKRFGCNPTENVYPGKFKRVSGLRERFRAAGGHIHIGIGGEKIKKDLATLVQVMDIVVGNTMVLIDRDPLNARRRVNYGRAGEYRPKSYGLEYRVLSNFWLRHYVLWSFATALVRNSIGIYNQGKHTELIASFEMSKVCAAINNNDYNLALENFKKLSDFFKANNIFSSTGLSAHNIDKVESWLTSDNPMSPFRVSTTEEILAGWYELEVKSVDGFEKFIANYNA